jgi:HEAT repeat protein
MSTPTIDYLIRVLQDKFIDLGVRDDAAMDLGAYNEPRVLEALIQTATDLEEHEMILASCGTSVMEIWGRKGNYSCAAFDGFAPAAKSACNVTDLPGSD